MKHLDYEEAIKIAREYKTLGKVTCFIFSEKNCPTCAKMLPYVQSLESDNFDIIKINDVDNIPFPLSVYPTVYFYIPNSKNKMPIHRAGGGTKEDVKFEIESCIEAFITCRDYEEVRLDKFNRNLIDN